MKPQKPQPLPPEDMKYTAPKPRLLKKLRSDRPIPEFNHKSELDDRSARLELSPDGATVRCSRTGSRQNTPQGPYVPYEEYVCTLNMDYILAYVE